MKDLPPEGARHEDRQYEYDEHEGDFQVEEGDIALYQAGYASQARIRAGYIGKIYENGTHHPGECQRADGEEHGAQLQERDGCEIAYDEGHYRAQDQGSPRGEPQFHGRQGHSVGADTVEHILAEGWVAHVSENDVEAHGGYDAGGHGYHHAKDIG